MFNRKFCLTVALALLCALLLGGFGGSALAADEPLAELHLEKNGLPLDLTLQKLALEDGKLVLSVGIDKIAGWKDETPPELIVSFAESDRKLTLDLFSADTVKSLPENAKNYKMTTKLPYEGTELPVRILVDIGEAEPLVFWEAGPEAEVTAEWEEGDAAAANAVKSAAGGKIAVGGKSAAGAGKGDDAQDAIDKAKKLVDAGEYYEAALLIKSVQDAYYGSAAADEGEALMEKIAEALADKEPKTGELERHFPFYGKNCVRATAKNGPIEMIITDTENNGQYTRFYVRKGETSEVYLPASTYTVILHQGNIWFGDDIGFGELGTTSDFGGDLLEMKSRVKGNTFSYMEWSPTF